MRTLHARHLSLHLLVACIGGCALVQAAAATLPSFIGHRLPHPAALDTPSQPTLADFNLKIADARVAPMQLDCQPATSPWNGAWLVLTADHRLLTNYDNGGYILVLRQRQDTTPIQASFACAKARSVTEQAICASPTLAAYDRSVATAYRFALLRAGDNAGIFHPPALEKHTPHGANDNGHLAVAVVVSTQLARYRDRCARVRHAFTRLPPRSDRSGRQNPLPHHAPPTAGCCAGYRPPCHPSATTPCRPTTAGCAGRNALPCRP